MLTPHSGPITVVAFGMLYFSMPKLVDGKTNKERLRGFDTLGGILSVCWSIPLLFALQEGGSRHPWNSSTIIGTLTGGIAALIVFGCYETWITFRTKKDAIFPICLLKDPSLVLVFL